MRGSKKKSHCIYAICFVDEGMDLKLTTDWEEAKTLMKGKPHLMKKFHTKQEILEWYRNISDSDIRRARFYSKKREEN